MNKMANSNGNKQISMYGFVHVRARGPGGEFLQCLSVDWLFHFENPPGASFRILMYSRMLSDVSRQLCRSTLTLVLSGNLKVCFQNFAVSTLSGYRFCLQINSVTFWRSFNV